MDKLPNINQNIPMNDNLKNYNDAHDFMKLNKFPVLPEKQLQMIIGI